MLRRRSAGIKRWNGFSAVNPSPSEGKCAYSNRNLASTWQVGHIDFSSNGTSAMTTYHTNDNLGRLTGISSYTNYAPMTSFAYGYNAAGQRVCVTNVDGSYWVYQYDALGQVVSGGKHWSDGTPVSGQQFGYNFDTIGNRTSASAGGDQLGGHVQWSSYTANLLNQYTQRTVPGTLNVTGSANAEATVSVNNQPANRYGSYFWEPLGVTNTGGAVWESVTNIAVLNQGTSPDIVATNIGNVFLPKTPEVYGYDLDGNLTNDGRWVYSWDGENRLTNMTSLSSAPTGSKYQLTFVYDFRGPRIQKIVSTNNGSAYVGEYTNNYVYDGWNCLAVLGPGLNLSNSFMWGSDLSGSMQGAGGVGGLLAENIAGSGVQFVAYDGNGNVSALANAASGLQSAAYEYGPFGEVIRATGPMAKVIPFRFSTKYQDDETDLLYYGYRYYNASTGRWPDRDPLYDFGSILLNSKHHRIEQSSLYTFVDNNPISNVEPNGLLLGTLLGALQNFGCQHLSGNACKLCCALAFQAALAADSLEGGAIIAGSIAIGPVTIGAGTAGATAIGLGDIALSHANDIKAFKDCLDGCKPPPCPKN